MVKGTNHMRGTGKALLLMAKEIYIKGSLVMENEMAKEFTNSKMQGTQIKPFPRSSHAVAAPAALKWGATKGARGSGGSDHALFYARKRPFYRQGMPMFTAGERCAVRMQLNIIRSSETVKILGLLMANVANKAMSAKVRW